MSLSGEVWVFFLFFSREWGESAFAITVVIPGKTKPHFLPLLVHSSLLFLLNTWLEAGPRLQLHPPSRYHGNAIWAYQDLKPKDILDNNTIAAQPGYLRDLDLWGEIWGVADWGSKSSLFLCLPHTLNSQTQSGLAFRLRLWEVEEQYLALNSFAETIFA